MSGRVETIQTEKNRKPLEGCVVGNEDLERLEVQLDRFNMFEAIGLVRQELRHTCAVEAGCSACASMCGRKCGS